MPVDELKDGIDRYVWPMTLADRRLSPFVDRACRALSLDDERPTFRPVLWNEDATAAVRLTQVWFAGVHAWEAAIRTMSRRTSRCSGWWPRPWRPVCTCIRRSRTTTRGSGLADDIARWLRTNRVAAGVYLWLSGQVVPFLFAVLVASGALSS